MLRITKSLKSAIIVVACFFLANAPAQAAGQSEESGHGELARMLMRCGGSMMVYVGEKGSFTDKTGQVWDESSFDTLISPVFLRQGSFLFLYDRYGWTQKSGKPIGDHAAHAMKEYGKTQSMEAAAAMIALLNRGYSKEAFGSFWETCSTVAVIAQNELSKLNK